MKIKRTAGVAALALVADVAGYAALIRPRLIRWGATKEEAGQALPGDEMVTDPRYVVSHAVTINAPVEAVWPWLVQMGQGRGGFYSYDWLENLFGLDIHSADRVIPELQRLEAGDRIMLQPDGSADNISYFEVAAVEPERSLVLVTPGSREENFTRGLPYGTWSFVLSETAEGQTRLIARMRADFQPSLSGFIVNKYGLEPIHSLMERKMLLGIRKRAERAAAGHQMEAAPGSASGLETAGGEPGQAAA